MQSMNTMVLLWLSVGLPGVAAFALAPMEGEAERDMDVDEQPGGSLDFTPVAPGTFDKALEFMDAQEGGHGRRLVTLSSCVSGCSVALPFCSAAPPRAVTLTPRVSVAATLAQDVGIRRHSNASCPASMPP